MSTWWIFVFGINGAAIVLCLATLVVMFLHLKHCRACRAKECAGRIVDLPDAPGTRR